MIKNLGTYAHPSKGGRNTNAGRHAAGANPAPGSGVKPPNKASQAEPASNKVKTASMGQMKPSNPMTNPTNQSAQAQSQISAPPAPFKTTQGIVNTPAPAVMPYGSTFKHTSGLSGSKAPAHPPKQYKIKTKSHMVGVTQGKRKIGKMTAGATKGGHSLLYGD